MSFRGSTNSRRKIGTARSLKRGEGGGGYIWVDILPEYNIRWQMVTLISGGEGLKTGGL